MIEFGYMPPWWWLAVGGAAALAALWLSYTASVGRPRGLTRFTLVSLRAVAVLLAVVCLLDPQWAERIERQQKARLAVALDTSRSMSIQDLDGPRLAAAKEWAQTKVLPLAPPHVGVAPFTFDQHLKPATNSSETAQPFDRASPTGAVTAIARALEALVTAPGADPLIGVVLCSDGIETESEELLAAARLCRRKGIPVHTATFGTTNELRDIVIENVQVKRAVASQAPTKVIVTLNSSGYNGVTTPVQIRLMQQALAQKLVTLNGERQRVELEFKPQSRNYHVFNVFVPPRAGEWLTANNRRPFGLEVVEPTIKVIYMEGTPMQSEATQPEWRYLKSALETDPQIKVKVLYRTRFRAGARVNIVDNDPVTGEEVYDVESRTKGYPRTLSELLQYDVVIHSDIPKESFSAEQLDYTAKLVEEHGGGFVMIGGKSAFGTGGYHKTVLDRFIPVAMESNNDTVNVAFRLGIPAEAWNHPLIAIGATREETTAIWTTKFPMLYGHNRVGRAKPGATVLGVNASYTTTAGPPIIMAVQEVGKGRTMAFTSDITRSWGRDYETTWGEPIQGAYVSEYNCDHRYYRRFWINAVRWLAANKIGRTNNPVILELAQTVARPGDAVPASVKVLDKSLRPAGGAVVELTLSAPGATNRVIPAAYDAAAQAYWARVPLPEAGDFTVTAAATVGSLKLGEDKQLVICEDADAELQDVRARPEVMAAIAKASGGKVLDPRDDGVAQARSLFGSAPPITVELRRSPMWDRFWLLASILAVLSAEWVLRRLRGLA